MNAIDVANWFIDKANSEVVDDDTVEGITNMKLQKLLYFGQAASLVVNNKPLFDDEMEAWEHGPVVGRVYHTFKRYGNQPISAPSNRAFNKLDEPTVEFLENIWDIFGKFSAMKLRQFSHDHKPWQEAYSSSSKIIKKSALKNYYKDCFKKI